MQPDAEKIKIANKKWIDMIKAIPTHSQKVINDLCVKHTGWDLHKQLSDYFFKCNDAWGLGDQKVMDENRFMAITKDHKYTIKEFDEWYARNDNLVNDSARKTVPQRNYKV